MNLFRDLVSPFATDIKNLFLDTIFPITCLVCKKEGRFICIDCKMGLKRQSSQHCIMCEGKSPFGFTHSGCQTPFGADGLFSIFDYHDENIAKIIINGKYGFLPGVFKELGIILASEIKNNNQLMDKNTYLVPIPLSKPRKRWRGFNQAEILCKTISKELNMPYGDLLVRAKSTKTQKDLKKEERIKNVEGCFKLKKGINPHGANIILIDDVVTTGSTLLEAVKVLKRNGAAKVWCLTVARD